MGFGYLIRDDRGLLTQASSRTIPSCFSPAIVEAMALREDVKWIIQLQLSHVVFETNCKAVVDAFHSHKIDQFEFGCLLKDCKTIFFFKCQLIPPFYQKASQQSSSHCG